MKHGIDTAELDRPGCAGQVHLDTLTCGITTRALGKSAIKHAGDNEESCCISRVTSAMYTSAPTLDQKVFTNVLRKCAIRDSIVVGALCR